MSEWRTVSIEDLALSHKSALATGPFGSAVASKNFRDSGVPMLRGSNLSDDVGVRLDERELVFLDPELAATFGRSTARKNDLVFTCWGTIGQIGLIDGEAMYDEYVVSNKQMKLTPDGSKVDSLFLYYNMSQPSMIFEVQSRAIGSTIPGFNLGQLRSLTVRIPELGEQRAIAAVLRALDDKIAANTKLATATGALAGLIYDRSAARFDARPMSEVLSPVLGGTPARSRADFWSGDQLWASAKDVTGAQFGVVLSTDEKITKAAVAGTKARPLPAGSVILTARGTVGAVARLAAPSSFNQSCYGFVPGDVPPGVLYFAITRAVLRAREIAHGSVFDTITKKTFDHLPFPDFDTDALTATEAKIAPLLETVVAVVRENSSLAATRDALLPQLMSGKLRVKGAEKVLEKAGL